MKSELSFEPLSFPNSQQISSDPFIICSGQNQAFQFCLNQKCTQAQLFTCSTKNCPCQKQHGLCKRGNINNCLQIINAKLKGTDDIKQYIQKIIEKVIDDLSEFRDNLIQQVQTSMKYGVLHQVQHKFLKISQNKINSKQITPKQAQLLWKIVTGAIQSKSNKFEQLQEKLNNFQVKILQKVYKTGRQIEEEMGFLEFKIKKNPLNYPQQLKYESSICSSSELEQRLEKMFPKKIKKFEVIYQASTYGFTMNKFKENCGKVENTVILALTSKEKIFGGYTPFCLFNGFNQWVADPQRRSFLFSLSQNAKFELENQNKAIYRYADGSLIRFGCDFYIYSGANRNMCMIGFQNSYKNQNFNNSPNSYLKLNGNINENCTLKDWQVLRVQFEEEND